MDWNEQDPFDSIIRDFFGTPTRKRRREEEFIESEEEDRVVDMIETKDKVFLVFEIPGFSQKDIVVMVKDRKIEIQAQKRITSNVQEYLAQKLQKGMHIKKTLPANVSAKDFTHTYKNGILEVTLKKK